MKRVSASFSLPIALERTKRYPAYRQLYDWFQRAIASGQLRPGQRLPSTRTVAADLNISRIPVLNAFEQLQAEGYLQTLVGAGTRVASSIPPETIRRPGEEVSRAGQKKGTRRIARSAAGTRCVAAEPGLIGWAPFG